jgi:hypothetical protein
MQDKYIDKSGDKKYFSIIPNYIVNHSSHWEKSLYLTIKRIAGEYGSCWMSPNKLGEIEKCSAWKIRNTLKKLEKRKWIKKIGVRGKTKPTNEYIIIDLWELNANYYIEKESLSHKESKRKFVSQRKKVCLAKKESLSRSNKEYIYKKNKYNNISQKDSILAKLLLSLIKENTPTFKKPNLDNWAYEINKIHRIDKRTYEQIEYLIRWAQQDNFWKANILSPAKLRKQFDVLVAQIKRKIDIDKEKNDKVLSL